MLLYHKHNTFNCTFFTTIGSAEFEAWTHVVQKIKFDMRATCMLKSLGHNI